MPPGAQVSLRVASLVALLAGCTASRDPGDLRLEARAILATAESSSEVLTLADLQDPGPLEIPHLVRVWRRGLDGSDSSCEGTVEVLDLEDYVRGVLPSEWMPGWSAASLDAGAVAARTYAAFWVGAGGRYRCADVDDTTWTQVYRDQGSSRTDEAVERTAGAVAVRDGSLVLAEYSAEHGGHTAFGVSDPHCSGETVQGHGRGMCQWGSQRWGLEGRDAGWILAHYYDGAELAWPDQALTDGVAIEVRSGERFELTLEVTNTGPEPWDAGAVPVRTDGSAFADESWASADEPLVHDAPVPAAGTATVTWWMQAPRVDEPTTYAEFFWLDGPASGVRGAEGSWHVTVLPPQAETAAPRGSLEQLWAWCVLLLGLGG